MILTPHRVTSIITVDTAFDVFNISFFYFIQVNHDLNTLKRLLRQAETDHYALYR